MSDARSLAEALTDAVRQLDERLATDPGATIVVIAVRHPTQAEPASPTMPDRPLTTAEVAAHFQVTPQTVQDWCRQGRLPGAVLFPRAGWRVPATALREVLAAPVTEAAQPTDGLAAWRESAPRRRRRGARS